MLLDSEDSQLILVDFQERLMPAIDGAQAVLANAVRLARPAQALAVPVLATEQNPAGLGPTVAELRSQAAQVLPKMEFSAAGVLLPRLVPPPKAPAGNARSLPRHLQKPAPAAPARGTLVMAGCEAHVCLLQTALELLDEELEVWVVTDACGSRTERNRDAAFDRLAAAGAELVTTEMVVFEWLRSSEHPRFKELQGLIK
ncbi:isochorismatase family protein [Ramlibacter rhizophilus]|uniref:Isochorismatase family protein n=1 Tax=Ramlibacter rhizophilus TaxID=1781167 RepID=A0A4Z0BVA1_9BURK|nr:isochorismatase family protein [Ramlibacter rhizophilus]TFZ03236.1 isochorismatase family protein [Ramlibacter rhizophilus]